MKRKRFGWKDRLRQLQAGLVCFLIRHADSGVEIRRRKTGMRCASLVIDFGEEVATVIAKRNAVFLDVSAVRHVVAVGDMVGVERHELLIGHAAMVNLVSVATLTTLTVFARLAANRARIAISFENGYSERRPDLLLPDHVPPIVSSPTSYFRTNEATLKVHAVPPFIAEQSLDDRDFGLFVHLSRHAYQTKGLGSFFQNNQRRRSRCVDVPIANGSASPVSMSITQRNPA
jgi:hypothetical protein